MANKQVIPPEIILQVAKYLQSTSALATLFSLSLTSKRHYELLTPLLYSRLELTGDQLKGLCGNVVRGCKSADDDQAIDVKEVAREAKDAGRYWMPVNELVRQLDRLSYIQHITILSIQPSESYPTPLTDTADTSTQLNLPRPLTSNLISLSLSNPAVAGLTDPLPSLDVDVPNAHWSESQPPTPACHPLLPLLAQLNPQHLCLTLGRIRTTPPLTWKDREENAAGALLLQALNRLSPYRIPVAVSNKAGSGSEVEGGSRPDAGSRSRPSRKSKLRSITIHDIQAHELPVLPGVRNRLSFSTDKYVDRGKPINPGYAVMRVRPREWVIREGVEATAWRRRRVPASVGLEVHVEGGGGPEVRGDGDDGDSLKQTSAEGSKGEEVEISVEEEEELRTSWEIWNAGVRLNGERDEAQAERIERSVREWFARPDYDERSPGENGNEQGERGWTRRSGKMTGGEIGRALVFRRREEGMRCEVCDSESFDSAGSGDWSERV